MKGFSVVIIAAVFIFSISNRSRKPKDDRKLIFDDDVVGQPSKVDERFVWSLAGNAIGGVIGLSGGYLWNENSNDKRKLMKLHLEKEIGSGIKHLSVDRQSMKKYLGDIQQYVESLSNQFSEKRRLIDDALRDMKSGLQLVIDDQKLKRQRIL